MACALLFQLATHPSSSALSVGPRFIQTLGWTSIQATLSTVISLLLGTLLAWALSHYPKFPGRQVYIALLSSALVLPTLVVVLGIVTVLGRSGWLNDALGWLNINPLDPVIFGLPGILIAHCYFNASYAARSLLNRFEAIPQQQLKLSRSLGLNSWQHFKMVELPAISGTLPNLAVTIFLLCFTSFAIVLVLGGSPKYNTLEVSIYEAIKLDFNLGRALGLAFTQLAICAVLVIAGSRFGRENPLISINSTPTHQWREPVSARALQLAIIIFSAALFLLPLIAVTIDGMAADFTNLVRDPAFRAAAFTSIALALTSTILVLLVCVPLAFSYTTLATEQRLAGRAGSPTILKLLKFSSTLYLAVPSLVLGLGFFLLARRIGGSHLMWAVIALLVANILMVLPFAIATLAPAMIKSANRYDKLAFSVGLSGCARWRMIELPLLHTELSYIACLAFCMSLGDLGIIALFGNQNFTTLPWLLYQKFGSYRTDDAAGIALIMLFITLAVFLLVPKLFKSIR